MQYSFNEQVNRTGTNCCKWDSPPVSFEMEQMLPFWVADSDYKTSPQIIKALADRVEHGIFGYGGKNEEYYKASAEWLERRHHWKVEESWIVPSCGVVTALSFAIKAFTEPGDKIIVQPPVYTPFYYVISKNDREIVKNPLKFNGVRYEMDFDDLEKKCASGAKMLIFCSPHNPVGRVWEQGELQSLVNICKKHGVILVSDEIHYDLIYSGHRHIPMGTFADYLDKTIVCTAASKTFNIAGLQTSNTIIADSRMRRKYTDTVRSCFVPEPNILGFTASTEAYRSGDDWLDSQMAHLEKNRDYLLAFISENLPEIRVAKPEGTYLAWLDMRNLGYSGSELVKILAGKGGIVLSEGSIYGEEGEGFMRFNYACSFDMLKEGLDRMKRVLR